jgi:hypothetical protein
MSAREIVRIDLPEMFGTHYRGVAVPPIVAKIDMRGPAPISALFSFSDGAAQGDARREFADFIGHAALGVHIAWNLSRAISAEALNRLQATLDHKPRMAEGPAALQLTRARPAIRSTSQTAPARHAERPVTVEHSPDRKIARLKFA